MRVRPLQVLAIGIPWGIVAAFAWVWLTGFVFGPNTLGTDPLVAETAWQGNRALLEPGQPTTVTGAMVSLTDNLRPLTETVRIGPEDAGVILDPLSLTCHGGRIRVTWTVGNLEPITPDTGIHLSARLDGQTIGSILRGSNRGIWNDVPTDLVTVADCSPGAHLLDLEVTSISGGWGIPYVVTEGDPPSTTLLVNRGFVVTEVWS
jgi:hypothetical protein